MSQDSPYSDFIHTWPQADVAFPGVEARLLAGKDGQAVFFRLPAGAKVPPHSHAAQWGIVVKGAIELTIGGKTQVYKPGDSYKIGDGQEHAGHILEESWIIDVFADPNRYKARG